MRYLIMAKKKSNKGLGKKIIAWIMLLVMVGSLFSIVISALLS